jgi:hypothetical protein
MLKQFTLLLFVSCCLVLPGALGQTDLFTTTKLPPRQGFLLGVNGNFDIPAGDMAKRFGLSYRLGPSIQYKTRKNWIFGLKAEFILGDGIREDSMFTGIVDAEGTFINQDGQRIGINRYERGFMAGVEAGKIINTSKKISDNGIVLLTGIGFMQHKILIQDKGESLQQLRGNYRKGYDRLTNGIYLEQYIGYLYLSDNGLINFHIGLDIAWGFTEGRRAYLFDVQRPGNDKRNDIFFGVRGGWYLPMFKRKSEEFYFE